MIHNDFERGFIKVAVIGYEEFIAGSGTNAAAKAAGKRHLEGKEYAVWAGEMITSASMSKKE